MTFTTEPRFIRSPYFVGEAGNWHLKEGASQEVIDEFNKFREDVEPRIKPLREGPE